MSSYFIGYDIGSSSVKIGLVDAETFKKVHLLAVPEKEMAINAPKVNWAEQDPNMWWNHLYTGTKKLIEQTGINTNQITGIGISYQMHGLVIVDQSGAPLRDAIIWCDGRAVEIGERAFQEIGSQKCMKQLLNSPGNFTASKLKWVKDNEPAIYSKIHKFMLPGDYIAYKLTGEIKTTVNGLSEGMFWDYEGNQVARDLLENMGISESFVPDIVENFSDQGKVTAAASKASGLPEGIPIIYRAGDQPNNALALNVFKPGEVAMTCGTSGVIYAVSDKLESQEPIRINSFAHVNYDKENKFVGKLLCLNGAGIFYRWLSNSTQTSYDEMSKMAEGVTIGSDGVIALPFGNGPERMLENKNVGAHFSGFNFNQHSNAHLFRAALEGIAFAFVYGLEILEKDNAPLEVLRAGNDNLFQAKVFGKTLSTLINRPIEIYETTGAIGAAKAAVLASKPYKNFNETSSEDYLYTIHPDSDQSQHQSVYNDWKKHLELILKEH